MDITTIISMGTLIVIGLTIVVFIAFLIQARRITIKTNTIKRLVESKSKYKIFIGNWRYNDWIFFPAYALFYVIYGIFMIFILKATIGYIAFIYTAFMIVYWIYYNKLVKGIPYIILTDNDITILKNPRSKLITILLSEIEKINVETWTDIPSRVKLQLSKGDDVVINLDNLKIDQRELFIKSLNKIKR